MTTTSDDVSIEFLKTHRLGVLATGRSDGSPQQSLIGYQFDGADIAISARRGAAKVKNIRRRPGVSLCVVDGGRVVVVFARARIVTDAEEVLQLNLSRLTSGRSETPVDPEALRERLAREERVVIILTPEKYLPSRL